MRRRDIILMHMFLLGIQYNNFIIENIVFTILISDRSIAQSGSKTLTIQGRPLRIENSADAFKPNELRRLCASYLVLFVTIFFD